MSKVFPLLLALASVALPLRAGTHAAAGVKAGIALSGLTSTAEGFQYYLGYELGGLSVGVLQGFQAGFFKAFDLSRRLQLQPEIVYALRGGDASTTTLYDDIVYRIRISYVEFPLLLKYRMWSRGAFSVAVFAGPYAALKLKAEKCSRIWNEEESARIENVKTFDYGIILGLSGEHQSRLGRVLLDLRAGYGLNNIVAPLPGAIPIHSGQDTIRNAYLSILVGYGF